MRRQFVQRRQDEKWLGYDPVKKRWEWVETRQEAHEFKSADAAERRATNCGLTSSEVTIVAGKW